MGEGGFIPFWVKITYLISVISFKRNCFSQGVINIDVFIFNNGVFSTFEKYIVCVNLFRTD